MRRESIMEAMRTLPLLTIVLAVGGAFGQQSTISVEEAKSLVRVVLRHEKLKLSSRYCELEQVRGDGRPFVPEYYSFSASCDYPNAKATSVLGLYVVSPRTGEVWEFNGCRRFRFSELTEIQRKIMRQTHATEAVEANYRKNVGCAEAK